ncbi:MAG TPA: class I SAM-dependent methyltransferase [Solirubrobacterales bacterium]
MTTEYQPFPNEEGRNNRQSQLEIPAMVWALGIPSDKRILEVGCGRGVALPVIDRLCSPRLLVGLDIDPKLLVEAAANLREHGTTAQLCAADVRRMPFADGAFDVIIDFGTLYHIAKPQAASAESLGSSLRAGCSSTRRWPHSCSRIRSVRGVGVCRGWSMTTCGMSAGRCSGPLALRGCAGGGKTPAYRSILGTSCGRVTCGRKESLMSNSLVNFIAIIVRRSGAMALKPC